jgi:hypothetical protein
VVGDARAHAGIAVEEAVHLVLVTGKNHNQIVTVVFHALQQDLDRFLAVVTFVLGLVEIVGLVDEKHPAHGALDHFAGFGRGVADILADEIVSRHRDHVAFADIAETMQDFGHPERHGGFPGTGVSGEVHVQRRRARGQAELAAKPVDQEQRRDLADAGLDGLQANEFAVELAQHLIDVGRLELGLQIDRFVRRGSALCYRVQHGFG